MSERDANADRTERYALEGRGLSARGGSAMRMSARWLKNANNLPIKTLSVSRSSAMAYDPMIDDGAAGRLWDAKFSDIEASFETGLDEPASLWPMRDHEFDVVSTAESERFAFTPSAAVEQDSRELTTPLFSDSSSASSNSEPRRQSDSWLQSRVIATYRSYPSGDEGIQDEENAHAGIAGTGDRSAEQGQSESRTSVRDIEVHALSRRVRNRVDTASVVTDIDDAARSGFREFIQGTQAEMRDRDSVAMNTESARRSDASMVGAEDGDLPRAMSDRSGNRSPSAIAGATDTGIETMPEPGKRGRSGDDRSPALRDRHAAGDTGNAGTRESINASKAMRMGMPGIASSSDPQTERRHKAPISDANRISPQAAAARERRPAPLDAASIAALLSPPAASSGPSVTIDRVQVTVQAPKSAPHPAPSTASAPHPAPSTASAPPSASASRGGSASPGYRNPWASYFTRHD